MQDDPFISRFHSLLDSTQEGGSVHELLLFMEDPTAKKRDLRFSVDESTFELIGRLHEHYGMRHLSNPQWQRLILVLGLAVLERGGQEGLAKLAFLQQQEAQRGINGKWEKRLMGIQATWRSLTNLEDVLMEVEIACEVVTDARLIQRAEDLMRDIQKEMDNG